jgi:Na+/H+-dicarboxylate symporter
VVGDGSRTHHKTVATFVIASWSFPTTDTGVIIQFIVTIFIAVALGVLVRKEQSLVLLVVGITLVTLGWYGIRGLH